MVLPFLYVFMPQCPCSNYPSIFNLFFYFISTASRTDFKYAHFSSFPLPSLLTQITNFPHSTPGSLQLTRIHSSPSSTLACLNPFFLLQEYFWKQSKLMHALYKFLQSLITLRKKISNQHYQQILLYAPCVSFQWHLLTLLTLLFNHTDFLPVSEMN